MLAILNLLDLKSYWHEPWLLLLLAFQVWMLVDAIRRREWFWAAFIFFFPVLNALLYYFLVYRAQPRATQGFELPGTHKRKRIKELEAQIHHLDKAHHHAELGDIYFQDGKLAEAEKSYRAAIERDSSDVDFQAHLGQCLLRQGKLDAAGPLLEKVARENPKHDYGHTLMGYAEALGKSGRREQALAAWQQVLEDHSYARARVQVSEFYIQMGEKERAKKELTELLADESHAAAFQKKQDRIWVKQAKTLLKEIG
ncbi:MAG TPA: tetratricopeptide repeat protein [Verrucomicrobiae bacterium]|nr:tetratricopeptide repeat protein [Verrucomicrobiae bacterium]